jgi:hypothetical protein
MTRSCAGIQSSISLTLSPMICIAPPQQTQVCVVDIEPHILARQMIGLRLAMGRPFGVLLLDPRTVLFAREIAVEIFKPERQLVGIEALGTAAELRALQLLDDRFSDVRSRCRDARA